MVVTCDKAATARKHNGGLNAKTGYLFLISTDFFFRFFEVVNTQVGVQVKL